jgi:hypothetical protein
MKEARLVVKQICDGSPNVEQSRLRAIPTDLDRDHQRSLINVLSTINQTAWTKTSRNQFLTGIGHLMIIN